MTTQNNTPKDIASFIEEVSGDSHLRVEDDLGDGFVRLKSSEAERRQAAQDIKCSEDVVIEMLRNSRDAHAKRVYIALQREESERVITIIDDGNGIPEALHARIFEPRVTSKLDSAHMDKWGIHGRGMALYSIAVNSVSSSVILSAPKLGSSIQIVTDTSKLPEKSDQSSFPYFEVQANGVYAMRGPKNILRIASEFALEHRRDISVWIGTPAEIISTLIAHAKQELNPKQLIFSEELGAVPLALRLGLAFDSETLVEESSKLGLEISTRTAYRILNGEIDALPSLSERLSNEGMRNIKTKSASKPKSEAPGARLKLSDSEVASFEQGLMQAFANIAQAHYLSAHVSPSISIDAGKLRISIPLLALEDELA